MTLADELRKHVEGMKDDDATSIRISVRLVREIADRLESNEADARRYRWLCDGNGFFMEENELCWLEGRNDKPAADAAIDAKIKEEGWVEK